jgi:tRNA (mo5U34)-methyltransferase
VGSVTWFHSIDLGQGVITPGHKSPSSLKALAEAFFGSFAVRGRTLIDVGAWDGFYSFEAKKRGAARVVASDNFVWKRYGRGGFDLARKQLGEIEFNEIDLPDLTAERFGLFDIVLFAGVFYHLLDGPKLLKQIATLAADLLIVETCQDMLGSRRPAMAYYPGAVLSGDDTNFWGPNPALIFHLLSESGFDEIFYRPHPEFALNQERGVYLAFRNGAALQRLAFDKRSPWTRLDSQSLEPRPGFVAKRTLRNAFRFLVRQPLA